MVITKLGVVKQSENPEFPNKHLLIEGKNLDKVEDVYFGDLKGIELEKTTTNEPNILRILPPNFSKYTKIKDPSEFENIEIKLKIDNPGPGNDAKYNVKFGTSDNLELVKDSNDKLNGDLNIEKGANIIKNFDKTKNSQRFLLEFNIKVADSLVGIADKTIKMIINKSEYDIKLSDIQKKLYINVDTIDETNGKFSSYEINTNDIFTGVNEAKKITIKDMKITYIHDNIDVLIPTGLFYRFDYTTTGTDYLESNPESWNIYLSEKIDNRDILLADDVKDFYKDIKLLTNPPPVPTKIPLVFKVLDVEATPVAGDETIYRITWNKPKDEDGKDIINNFRYAFLINVLPKSGNDNFSINDDQVFFDKEVFDFSTAKLTPGNEYSVQISTLRTDQRKVIDLSDQITFKYVPKNFDEYHSHLFNPLTKKFDSQLMKEKPELIKTYYQLLAANKLKMINEMDQTKSHISNEAQCIDGNLSQLQTNSSNDKFDDNFKDILNKNSVLGKLEFKNKQGEQKEQIDRITEKISELEKLQGKVKKNQNTKIKSITSIKDGNKLSVKKISNGKYMVGLNQGCLSSDSGSGNYNYKPCNIFDKKQYFDLDSIENNDEYNNLLLMNQNSKLSEDSNVEYPFYILKPNKSTKCVHFDNKQIKIKPCNDEESIRYIGNFSKQECDK